MENDFETALNLFIADAQKNIDEHFAKHYPNLTPTKLTVDKGGVRFLRVVKNDGSHSRSVFCFVEKATGNVYKAASWKAPAKGIRGNILRPALDSVSIYGAHYAR